MDSLTAEGRAASKLLAHKEALAQAITVALFTEMPDSKLPQVDLLDGAAAERAVGDVLGGKRQVV